MPTQPNKPGAEHPDGTPEPTDDQPAVENQGTTTPDVYPEPASGEDMGGSTPVKPK